MVPSPIDGGMSALCFIQCLSETVRLLGDATHWRSPCPHLNFNAGHHPPQHHDQWTWNASLPAATELDLGFRHGCLYFSGQTRLFYVKLPERLHFLRSPHGL